MSCEPDRTGQRLRGVQLLQGGVEGNDTGKDLGRVADGMAGGKSGSKAGGGVAGSSDGGSGVVVVAVVVVMMIGAGVVDGDRAGNGGFGWGIVAGPDLAAMAAGSGLGGGLAGVFRKNTTATPSTSPTPTTSPSFASLGMSAP